MHTYPLSRLVRLWPRDRFYRVVSLSKIRCLALVVQPSRHDWGVKHQHKQIMSPIPPPYLGELLRFSPACVSERNAIFV